MEEYMSILRFWRSLKIDEMSLYEERNDSIIKISTLKALVALLPTPRHRPLLYGKKVTRNGYCWLNSIQGLRVRSIAPQTV